MGGSWTPLVALVLLLATATRAAPLPGVDSDAAAPDTLQDRVHIVESLEDDISRTALLAAAARAVREQQTFENDILKDTVATLVRDRGDPEQLRRDVRQLKELVARDQAQVEVLSAVLRAPRQAAEGGASASASAGSDSGSILSLLPTLLGGSSGGNGGADDDDDEDGGGGGGGGGGGSDSGSILQLLPAVLGGSSGSGGDGDSGGGGSNVLSLVSGLFGSSSGGGGGGDGESGGGGGSNVLSLVSGLFGASSGGGGGDSSGGSPGGFKGLILDKIAPTSTVKPVPGTYDDLIGKGLTGYDPVAVFSSNLGGAIRTKFNVFNSLFSVLTSVLGASSGGGGGGGGGAFGAAASLSKS